jgi:hypothetical protein
MPIASIWTTRPRSDARHRERWRPSAPPATCFWAAAFSTMKEADRVGMGYGLASDVGGGTSFSPFHTMLAAYYVGRRGRPSRPEPFAPAPVVAAMSIKSDKWIRRMAEEHGMIEPFEPGQVREADGHKIVSYGTSSYGYDIRCAPEFKVFTNIHSTVVDPKNFDEKSFVDFHGDSLHHPAQQLCAGPHGGVLPHSAQRAHHLPGQEHLCALRHHRQRHAVRARVGRLRDAGVPTPRRCPPRSTRARAAPRCCSSRATTTSARSATRTAAASTRASAA